ncbi:hypothetical protein ACFPAF_16025 [Hymenobacter endophyticus]|nr:hypothetical protein [Hymenobacter endophyticus]
MPEKYTVNPYEGEWRGHGTGRYMHQFPVLVSKRIGQYNIQEIDTLNHTYLVSFRLDAVLGSGLNWNNRTCEDCGSLSGGGLAYDVIEFEEKIITKRRFGTFVTAGATARFYRLGKERLNLSLYYTQGLTDMLLVPVEYRYNSQRGSTTLRIRGSGFSATLGVPIRLKTFKKSAARSG